MILGCTPTHPFSNAAKHFNVPYTLTAQNLNTNPHQSEFSGKIAKRYPEVPSVSHAVIRGSVGFGLVSLAAFSVWAFGGKWFQSNLGEAGLFGACAFVFVALSGLLLHPLVKGPGSLFRFYSVFIPAFLAYAIAWCIAWFALRFGPGEWLGSLLGSACFVSVMSCRMRSTRGWIQTSLILFALHSAGYFLGGKMMHWILGPAGSALFTGLSKAGLLVLAKLAWGLLYGFGFGAGIGYAFHAVQKDKAQPDDRGG